jgi:L-seryl-tRNA(Ser) seleniumtransferase
MGSANDRLRKIPAVERVLQHPAVRAALESGEVPRALLADVVRDELDAIRREILAESLAEAGLPAVAARCLEAARRRLRPRLRALVNATGVVLHTNLGRAPLAEEAVRAAVEASGYCNLEYDLERGARGRRHDLVREILCELTGAEDALVVNNNAAAVLLALTALAEGREVVVSRGQLVEIGGAFRIPEVMAQSGARLREVGTTNKTRPADYEAAITPDTALLLRVHTSNYRVCGFTEEVTLPELVALGRTHHLPVVEDVGSGLFYDLSAVTGEKEPLVRESVAAGADLVTFSGDKLLGGPQAGILLGRREPVAACAAHPLMRALRPDKLTLAALQATLALYRDPARAAAAVPTLRMLLMTSDRLRGEALALAEAIRARLPDAAGIEVVEEMSEAGGGSLPLARFPTHVVAVRPRGGGVSLLEARLRANDPPVVARVKEDALLFDPRTLLPGQAALVAEAVSKAFSRVE